MRCELIRDVQAFHALAAAWNVLAAEVDAGLFLSHRWLEAWWRAYRGADELWVLTLGDGARLTAAWPLHLRAPRSAALRVAELRLLGDLGGAQRSLVCKPDDLPVATLAFLETLAGERSWDLLEVPVVSKRVADAVERAVASLAPRGIKMDSTEVAGRAYADLPPPEQWDDFMQKRRPTRAPKGAVYGLAPDVGRGLDELQRLLRKEWAAREAASPAADPQAVQFLSEMVPELAAQGLARVGWLTVGDRVVAADLVVRDRERRVQLLRGVDPEHLSGGAAEQLTIGSLKIAVDERARRFELAPSSTDDEDSPLKTGVGKVPRVRVWNGTTVARLHHGVVSIKDAVKAAETFKALDKLRDAAPEVVQRAVARVATYATLHLYRGELFTRDVREAGDLAIGLYTRADFEALGEAGREEFATRLDLQPSYCRQKWDRGDTVVLARLDGWPAGIVWCARTAVYVPDIGREVRPVTGECYIHDVYVHPDVRGRQVAPAMLDFLARELRARDVYRAWALIERSNTASTRAFEKAAYASVADVVYARMGLVSRLIVRPPDPEARSFLGLP